MLILVAANARLIVENLLKYGVLTSPANWLKWLVPRGNFPLLLCWPALALSVLIANGIEKLGAARLKAEKKVGNNLLHFYAHTLRQLGFVLLWVIWHLQMLKIFCNVCLLCAGFNSQEKEGPAAK